MNENQKTVEDTTKTEDTTKVKETGAVDTQTTNQNEEKTLTQKEVDDIVKDRLEREKKKLPSKEELTKFNEWKESQKTEADKQAEKELKLTQLEQEKLSLKNENILLKKGVKVDDVDYVLFKVSKMEGEFETNLDEYLKDNVKYTKEELKETTGIAVNKNTAQKESGVSAILKAKHPELYN